MFHSFKAWWCGNNSIFGHTRLRGVPKAPWSMPGNMNNDGFSFASQIFTRVWGCLSQDPAKLGDASATAVADDVIRPPASVSEATAGYYLRICSPK